MRISLLLPLLTVACIRDASPPYVGECADYPSGDYTFGEIGIGDCVASPVDVTFLDRSGELYLAISNSNAFRDFSSASMLFLDWASIDLGADKNLVSDLDAHAVPLPHFLGMVADIKPRNLLAVPERFSEDARTRIHPDDLHFLDITDPMAAAEAGVAEDSASSMEVGSDPFPVSYAEGTGYLYVGNRTSHTISVVDTYADPMIVVDASPEMSVGYDRWFDADASGSIAAFSVVEAMEDYEDLIFTDSWSLTWAEGTYRVWLPDGVGLARYDSGGGGSWRASSYGTEMDPADSNDVVTEVRDPHRYESSDLGTRMLFSDMGSIRAASPDSFASEWYFDDEALMEGESGAWDAWLGGPCALQVDGVTWLFYDGRASSDDPASGIGIASSVDGLTGFEPSDAPLLIPGGAHDAVGQADPFVIYDEQARQWRMFYSAWDGASYSLGQAWSEDLEAWTASPDPILTVPGGDVAAPAVEYINGAFHLYHSWRSGPKDPWQVGESMSVDGWTWSSNRPVAAYESLPGFSSQPPGVALQINPTEAFDMVGEESGDISVSISAGTLVESTTFGWRLRVSGGEQAGLDEAGEAGVNGLSVGSFDPDLGLAWLDLVDADGQPSIGVAVWSADRLQPQDQPILEAGENGAFDDEGVSDPVVMTSPLGGYVMYYAGHGKSAIQVGRATSPDGLTWTRDGDPVLGLGEEWDAAGVRPGSVETLDDGSIRLWYTGTDGDHEHIGAATSANGQDFERVEAEDGWILGTGAPGDWDDSGVRTPFVVRDGESLIMLYAGSDGDAWRIGVATADPETLVFTRLGEADEATTPILQGQTGLFDYGGVDHPVLFPSEHGWSMFYRGIDADVFRPGLAWGPSADVMYKAARVPTAGDSLVFTSIRGEDGVNAISLDQTVAGYTTDSSGQGWTGLDSLLLDEERGYLYVASKNRNYIIVIDVRDDSEAEFSDLNHMGIEALLSFAPASGGTGFRGMMTVPGKPWLYALNDSPEGIWIFDLAGVLDDEFGDVIRDSSVGWLPAARGLEEDRGADTVMSVGPASMALLPDGYTLLAANYNSNSLAAYDLRMGNWGQQVATLPFVCENPGTLRVSPDGRFAAVTCYEGVVDEGHVLSGIAIVDADTSSPTWMQVLTWIGNE